MKWVLYALLGAESLGLAACAHIEPPPGGPEDKAAPELIAVRPDSLSVSARGRDPVVFVFNERIGEQGVEDAVLVSPRTSRVEVSRRGDEIRVGLQEGWEPDRIYQVTVLPTLQDLFNNRVTEPIRFVFSTGPQIPDTRLAGTVVDLVTDKPEVEVRVEAIRATDSLVYATPTDSAGRFVFARIPEGEYQIRALRDLNRNRELDPFEPSDSASARVVAGDSAGVRLAIVAPDTTPPTVASASVVEGKIELQFDDYLTPDQAISPVQVQITSATAGTIQAALIRVGRPPARDAAQDTTAVQDPVVARDTAVAQGTPTSERLPSQTLVIEPVAPLAPATEYQVRINGIRNVVGLSGGGEATFTTPPAAPPG